MPSKEQPVIGSRRLPSCGTVIYGTSTCSLCPAPLYIEHRAYYWPRYLLLRRFGQPVTWPRRLLNLGNGFYVGSSIVWSRDSALEAWSRVAPHFERGIELAGEHAFVVRDATMISLKRGFTLVARRLAPRRAVVCEVYLRMDYGRSYSKREALQCVESYETLVKQIFCSLTG